MACRKCPRSATYIAHGLTGAAKAVLGLDRAPQKLISHRRALCSECPHAVPCKRGTVSDPCWCGKLWDGLRSHSPACGCSIPLKTRLKSEHCPLNIW